MTAPLTSITGARTASGTMDLPLREGKVASGGTPVPGPVLEANGAVVMPAFVDAHVHLDKAHLLAPAGHPEAAPGLNGAIQAMQDLRKVIPADGIARGARRGVQSLVAHGVLAARAHIEIDASLGLDMLALHRDLQVEFEDRIDLQLSAFPQHGIDGTVARLLEQALADGVEVVGGCPYADADQEAHLDVVFDLADRHQRPVDLHLDFDDDPSGSMIDAVVTRTRALGMQGRVTIGHVTKLAAMGPDQQSRAFDALADAGVSLVVMPATDLYLGGAGEPGTRSLAPVERAARAGVRVAISNNNLHNTFSPYGNGSLLQAAWTVGLTRHLNGGQDLAMLQEAITHNPSAILGRPRHGTALGDVADLVLLDLDDPQQAVLCTPAVLASIRRGTLVHEQRRVRTTALEGSLG